MIGEKLYLEATKYDGSPHWRQPFRLLNDHGNLFVAEYQAGDVIQSSKGDWRSPYNSRVYFWRDRWYNCFRLSRPGGPLELWYCNVTTPALLNGSISYVDLDLDVALWADGRIELLDEDEYAENSSRYGYPPEVKERAEAAAAELRALAQAGAFPFSEG